MTDSIIQIDPAQMAVLADRLERMTDEFKGLRSAVDDVRLTLARFETAPGDIAALKLLTVAHSGEISRHGFIIKLCGVVLISCVGLIGWGWREGKSIYEATNFLERRLMLVEYKVGIPPNAEGER